MTEEHTYRLITRDDFDGIVCGSLLTEQGLVKEIAFAHPRDLQDGKFPVTGNDVIANLPYVPGAHMCFDHHVSESYRVKDRPENLVLDVDAPSTARVIYDHFGGAGRFTEIADGLMEAVDKADSADYSIEEVLAPEGWTLINFVLDPRTGLEGFQDFELSRDDFMTELVHFCKRNPVEEVLQHPDVVDRIAAYQLNNEFADLQIERCATVHGKTVVVDFRNEEKRFPGNRFMVYGLFPDCDISIKILRRPDTDMNEIALGKSIIDRDCPVNIGELMHRYGGGGHRAAGTCRASEGDTDRILGEILEHIEASRKN